MKPHQPTPATVTSLPQSRQQESDRRMRNYLITMGVRMLCLALMVLVTPYSWYTWVFAAGAALLPYVAVVFANVAMSTAQGDIEPPAREISATGTEPLENDGAPVITIHEHGVSDEQS